MRHDFLVSGKVAKITKEATLQHDEPRRPGAARPSLLSAEPQADAARTNILGNLEGGKKPAPAAVRAAGPKPAGRGMVWGGAALVVALLGGGAVWLGTEPDGGAGHGRAPILADDARPAPAATPQPPTAAMATAPALAEQASAAPAAADTGAAPAVPGGDATAAGIAQAAAAAPGNSADLVAALAAPSRASTAATIQEEAPAQRQSLRDMLNAPSDTKAAPLAPKVAGNDSKANAKAGKPARAVDKSDKSDKSAKTARAAKSDKADKSDKAARTARAGKPAAPAKAQPAPAPDSDVALLAALVAHTHASTAARQPESLSAKLKQCRQLSAKSAEQCRTRTCATAKDDPLCKPVVTAAVEGAFP
jgi:hypothetical protein